MKSELLFSVGVLSMTAVPWNEHGNAPQLAAPAAGASRNDSSTAEAAAANRISPLIFENMLILISSNPLADTEDSPPHHGIQDHTSTLKNRRMASEKAFQTGIDGASIFA